MKSLISTIFAVCSISSLSIAQQATLTGTARSEGEPMLFANVALLETNFGTSTDENGFFELNDIPAGTYQLLISAIGYRKLQQKITVGANETLDLGVLELQEDVLGLQEVVVTGTMKETFISDSPIKVDVITARYLEKNTSPVSIVEGVTLVNGVQEVVACGVCFTNSISINGLPGPYTAVLMDGTPMYGSLASVYGLNGIPTMIIDRFEVIKGPSSTLYGSEAVAGVINIITKDPAKQPIFSVDIMGTSHLESFGNVAFAPKIGKFNGYVGLNYAYINDFDDRNEDGFGDVVNLDRLSAFTKWTLNRKDGKKFTLAGKYYYEDRRNGVEAFLKNRAYRDVRGSTSIYGESIYTNRVELFGTYELPTEEHFKLDYSFSNHLQDSYYGADYYEATQRIAFTNFIWNKILGKHDVLLGLTGRYQFYDDNTVATVTNGQNQPDEQVIAGLFAQDEWQVADKVTLLAGSRFDYYKKHGLIFAPRLNIKYKPATYTTLRANFGTGFRIVNLFAEDHAFVTGQRTVEIVEELQPERSYNGSLNLNHIYILGDGQGSLDIDAFYTYFTNKIIPNYDEPGKIIYANTDGHAISRGIGLGINHQFGIPVVVNIGVNVQKVTQTEPDDAGIFQTFNVNFAPEWSSVSTINYEWKKPKLTFAYTLRLTGSMALPEVYDLNSEGQPIPHPRPTRSEPFAFQNIQLTKEFPKQNIQLYIGIQNLFNYVQPYSPLVGYNDPTTMPGFSTYFDTAYAYAPIHGRELYVGVKWNTGKR